MDLELEYEYEEEEEEEEEEEDWEDEWLDENPEKTYKRAEYDHIFSRLRKDCSMLLSNLDDNENTLEKVQEKQLNLILAEVDRQIDFHRRMEFDLCGYFYIHILKIAQLFGGADFMSQVAQRIKDSGIEIHEYTFKATLSGQLI